jgi:hypothetical protein
LKLATLMRRLYHHSLNQPKHGKAYLALNSNLW